MKKLMVFKVEIHDDKDQQKVMKAASSVSGVVSVHVDMKERKLKAIGNVDPAEVLMKLRKDCCANIDTVIPLKEQIAIHQISPEKQLWIQVKLLQPLRMLPMLEAPPRVELPGSSRIREIPAEPSRNREVKPKGQQLKLGPKVEPLRRLRIEEIPTEPSRNREVKPK
ncbi:hypothetical protein NE237_014232 [Protea cynaroides]|uniref:HMA domain-containing protein n=1 Tax=Protea cynaroides TaxID=273540 RepID=A0A9Q0JQR9_9MAGN|nr:hypothetical protein NE237_014232 [Protea cynaroides]